MLNAAEGTDCNQIMTGHDFYQGTGIVYHGISANDDESYDLSKHFDEASDFIKMAIGEGTLKTILDLHFICNMHKVNEQSGLGLETIIKHKELSKKQLLTIQKT